MNAPAIIDELVATVPQLGPEPPRAIAWKEYDDKFVIVFEDGRKLSFKKEDHGDLLSKSRRKQTTADMKPPVAIAPHEPDEHRAHKEK